MTQIIKFMPQNGFYGDITGESGCANCGHNPDPHSSKGNCMYPNCQCKEFIAKKKQTIRPKPIEIGTKVALWEMWRGMKHNLYDKRTWTPMPPNPDGYPMYDYLGIFPRKLLDAKISACEPIEMVGHPNTNVILRVKVPDFTSPSLNGEEMERESTHWITIDADKEQRPFVKADTPNWTNKQFIDFFLTQYPAIRKKWTKFWIWRWGA